jgi:hypothetical protein
MSSSIEDDHVLSWVEPSVAIKLSVHKHHSWVVTETLEHGKLFKSLFPSMLFPF